MDQSMIKAATGIVSMNPALIFPLSRGIKRAPKINRKAGGILVIARAGSIPLPGRD
jgi:hypothetical protein